MRKKTTIILLLFLTISSQVSADETIPFRMVRGAIIFDVEMAGKTYPFLFDSGGGFTISNELQAELGLKPVSETTFTDSQGNHVTAPILALPDMRLGNQTYSGLFAMRLDIRNIAGMNCYGIEGVVGPELMEGRVWKLDFERKELTISNKAATPQEGDYVTTLVKRYSGGQPWLYLSIGERDSLLTCFDTGSNGTLSLNSNEVGDLRLAAGCKGSMVECGLTGTGGGGYGRCDTLQSVRLSEGLRLGTMPVHDAVIQQKADGFNILGTGLISRSIVTLDYISEQIIFTPRPYEHKPSGVFPIRFGFQQGKIIVSSLKAYNLHELPRIPIGSQVLAVNGTVIPEQATPEDYCDLLSSDYREQTKLRIKILLPDGRTKKVILRKMNGL